MPSLRSAFRKRWLARHNTPKSPHREHDPRAGRGHQGAGQAKARGRIHAGLASIFTGKYEGAGILDQLPKKGFNVSIAGDRESIGLRFPNVDDVDGVWEGEKEQSYLANMPERIDAETVLSHAAWSGKENDQDAVFVRYDGNKRPGPEWEQGRVSYLITPHGVVDMVNASPKNIRAAAALVKKNGYGILRQQDVWTRLLEKGVDY